MEWSEQILIQLSQFSAAEIERSLLDYLLINQEPFPRVQSLLRADDFTEPNNILYQTMLDLVSEDTAPDYNLVINRLKINNQLDLFGGNAQMASSLSLVNSEMVSKNIDSYCQAIWEAADKRRATRKMSAAYNEMRYNGKKALDIAESFRRDFEEIGKDRRTKQVSFADRLMQSFELLSERCDREVLIKTGLADVDTVLGGFDKGDLVILAARPSVGKTMFSLNIAYNLLHQNKRIAYISREMSCDRVITRLVSRHTQINSKHFRSGELSQQQMQAWAQAMGDLADLPLYLYDSKDKVDTFDQIATHLRSLKGQIDLVTVDHLLLLNTGDQKLDANPVQKYSYLSGAFKKLAQELDVPVILLSQLNRDLKGRASKRPELTDLKESGAIEQDADIVIFLHRDDYFERDSVNRGIAEVIIAKNRDGELGSAYVKYIPQVQLFTGLEPGERYVEEEPEKGRYIKGKRNGQQQRTT